METIKIPEEHSFLESLIIQQISVQETNRDLFRKILRRVTVIYVTISLATLTGVVIVLLIIKNII